jgi:hypothetical protein
MRRGWLVVLILVLISTPGIAGKKKSIVEIKGGLVGMIGYGTLMLLPSLEKTLGHRYEGLAYQVHLTGYIRGWALRRPLNDPQANSAAGKIEAGYLLNDKRVPLDGMVNLNIYPEKNGRMNCILYLLGREDLLKVDQREGGYARVDVTGRIEEYGFSGGHIYVYEGLPEHPDTAAADPGKYILVKEYLDQVTKACDGIGKNFRAEFDRSTRPVAYRVVSFMNLIWKKSEN